MKCLILSQYTSEMYAHPLLSYCLAHADFRNPVQQFEKLSSSNFCLGVVWGEGGSSAQCGPTDDHS